MSRYIVKYMNLEMSKRLTFWNGGSIYDEINYISNLLLTSCQRPNIYVNLFAFFLDIYDGACSCQSLLVSFSHGLLLCH